MATPVFNQGVQQNFLEDDPTDYHASEGTTNDNRGTFDRLSQEQVSGSPASKESSGPSAGSPAAPPGSTSDHGGMLEALKTGLDVLGFFPVAGTVANLASAGISLAQGKYGEAALSAAAATPVVGVLGEAAKGAKLVQKGIKTGEKLAEGGAKITAKAGENAVAAGGKEAEGVARAGENAAAKSEKTAAKTGDETAGPAKTFQTYTKTHPETGDVYSGRTSGTGTPEENVNARDVNHHKTNEGFGPAKLDKSSSNPDAIRGREQQLIEYHGGAKTSGGTSGNEINGIRPDNPKRDQYMNAADQEFGRLERPK